MTGNMQASITAGIYRKRNLKLGEEVPERTQSRVLRLTCIFMVKKNKKHIVQAHFLSMFF